MKKEIYAVGVLPVTMLLGACEGDVTLTPVFDPGEISLAAGADLMIAVV